MPEPHPFTELVDPPPGGRQFTVERWPGLGDCAPSGRMRLDALARWLQDVAYDDVEDAGLAPLALWVVRRTRIAVHRWPRFAERHVVRTFCSGLGRMWAERRTTIELAGRDPGEPAAVEAVGLWVHLDTATRMPAPFSEAELALYGAQAAGRLVRARLRHPAPPPGASAAGWRFRAVDCDIAGHVNNAAYWQPLEEELIAAGPEPGRLDAELEFRAGAQPGALRILRDGARRWLTDDRDEVVASFAVEADGGGPAVGGAPDA